MAEKIPKRLRREPLIEAIWHLIYEPAMPERASGDLLVGILYTALKERGRVYQMRRLLAADIPPEIAEQDPNLRYTVKYRLESQGSPVLFQIGDRIVSLNCRRPYVGWPRLREDIAFLRGVLQKSEFIVPKRHGLRYIDLIRREDMPDLGGLRVELKVGDQEIREQPVQLRVEIGHLGKTHIVQIISPAKADLPDGETWEGTLIDLETGSPSLNKWDSITAAEIDELHEASKSLFFTQILTPAIIEKLEPEYE
ncbi:TIGR04255 family protein [Candidatus Parcubacteria bacterium]|nr:MAG: TIGR04255 family protein [Candidatus Parcubacteria bacterium]